MFQTFQQPPGDPINLPLTYSPLPIICILTGYLLFTLKLGQIFMKNRPPYNVKRAMLIYNAIQIIYNAVIFYYCTNFIFIRQVYKFRCMERLPYDHPSKNIERYNGYMYLLNKILDLTDTIFFVLRKRYTQITFLHIYHHVMMVTASYLFIRFYGYGGHVGILVFLNTLVHVVMYSYYFLTALKPEMKHQIWWKKYITLLQMMQFAIIFTHTTYVMLFSQACPYPRLMLWVHFVQASIMLYMFTNFYISAYVRPKHKMQNLKFNENELKAKLQ